MNGRTLLILLLTGGGAMAHTTIDPAAALGRDRVLLAFAPTTDDPSLQRQRELFAAGAAGSAERGLVFIPLVGDAPEAAALRRRYGASEVGFEAVLVGKDGGAKLRSATPISADRLFATIDTMPMRRAEMRR